MSQALFEHGGLRFWNENEIQLREMAITKLSSTVRNQLSSINPAWKFVRCEGPILHPRSEISSSYDDTDIFTTNHKDFCLRAETTPSSYAYARSLKSKLPLCVWQAGISSRRENSDGASASKLRFNCFWQLEFQCIYSIGTLADYRARVIPAIARDISWLTGLTARIVDSDRLPSYSLSTQDIEVYIPESLLYKEMTPGYREIASCSIRTDYSDDTRVAEFAIGLDRIASFGSLRDI